MPDPAVYGSPAIVDGKIVGNHFRHGIPVADRVMREEAVGYSACRVFQLLRWLAELVEAGERGVDVCLVENFAAAGQVAVYGQNIDVVPLGVETLLRGPVYLMGDDHSEITQPMHSLDVNVEVRAEVP